MIDKEKVISVLKEQIEISSISDHYFDVIINWKFADDTLVLLEEQKSMKPIYSEEKFGDFLPHCSICKKVLPNVSQYGKSNFCYNCGKAVKWE